MKTPIRHFMLGLLVLCSGATAHAQLDHAQDRAIVATLQSAVDAPDLTMDGPAAWQPEIDELYLADVYPSQAAALDALARAAQLQLTRRDLSEIGVAPSELAAALQTRLEQLGVTVSPGAAVQLELATPADADLTDSVVQLTSAEPAEPADPAEQNPEDPDAERSAVRHPIAIQLVGDEVEWSASTQFVSVPWVAGEGVSEQQVVVRGLASLDTQAAGAGRHGEDVLDQAIRQELIPRLQAYGVDTQRPRAAELCRSRLRDHLIEREDLVQGRFAQHIHKTIDGEQYHIVSREALLLDVSDEKLDRVGHRLRRELRHGQHVRRASVAVGAGSIVLLLLLVGTAHWLLDRFTQGYYVWPLRLASLVVLLVTCGTVAKIAHAVFVSH